MEKIIKFNKIENENFLLNKYEGVVETRCKYDSYYNLTNSSDDKILFESPLLKISNYSVPKFTNIDDIKEIRQYMKLILRNGDNLDEYKLFCKNIKNLENKIINTINKEKIILIYRLSTKENKKLPHNLCKMICDYFPTYKSVIKDNLISTLCYFNNIKGIYTNYETNNDIIIGLCPTIKANQLISCIRSIYLTPTIQLKFNLDFGIKYINKNYFGIFKIKRIEIYGN
jgi:hypothetical protein